MAMSVTDPDTGGVWFTDPTGALYAEFGAPYIQGANLNTHPAWQAGGRLFEVKLDGVGARLGMRGSRTTAGNKQGACECQALGDAGQAACQVLEDAGHGAFRLEAGEE